MQLPDAEAARTFGRFVWDDVKGTLRVGARTWAVAGAVVAAIVFAIVAAQWATKGMDPPPRGAADVVVMAAVLVVYALFKGALVGGVVAAARVCWRLFGASLALPAVLAPVFFVGAYWLAGPWILRELRDVFDAARAAAHEIPAGSLPLVAPHAGGAAALILLAFLLPLLAWELVRILLTPAVLWQFAQFVALTTGVGVLALALAAALSAPVVGWVFVRRMRARYREWEKAAGG